MTEAWTGFVELSVISESDTTDIILSSLISIPSPEIKLSCFSPNASYMAPPFINLPESSYMSSLSLETKISLTSSPLANIEEPLPDGSTSMRNLPNSESISLAELYLYQTPSTQTSKPSGSGLVLKSQFCPFSWNEYFAFDFLCLPYIRRVSEIVLCFYWKER